MEPKNETQTVSSDVVREAGAALVNDGMPVEHVAQSVIEKEAESKGDQA